MRLEYKVFIKSRQDSDILRNLKQKKDKLKKLKESFKNCATLLIVMQSNPDPDAIASAYALKKLANSLGELQCSIIGGTIDRAENRMLVEYLGISLREPDLDVTKFDLIAMVDTQPGTGNNPLPSGIIPNIVIDHHPVNKFTRKCKCTDIRNKYGATATIMYEYLKIAGVTIEPKMATALLYGIKSDTQDLGRDARQEDFDALHALYKFANLRMLSNIQRGLVKRDYFQMLCNVLGNAKAYPNAVISSLGYLESPDMIAEACDLLLRDEKTCWSLVYGFTKDHISISLRTSQVEIHADSVIKKIVARRGTGGGHPSYAGGQIPLKKHTKTEKKNLEKVIKEKFLAAINDRNTKGTSLIKYDKELITAEKLLGQ